MKTTILAAALLLASAAAAQAPAPEAAKPVAAAQAAAPAPEAAKPAPKTIKARKATAKRFQDARHCLQRASNDAIIRCAEEYL